MGMFNDKIAHLLSVNFGTMRRVESRELFGRIASDRRRLPVFPVAVQVPRVNKQAELAVNADSPALAVDHPRKTGKNTIPNTLHTTVTFSNHREP